jgi:hypothetical protein
MARCLFVVLALICVAFPFTGVHAQDASEVASEFVKMLKNKQYPQADILWDEMKDTVLDNLFASIKVGKAWVRFGGSDLAMQYQEIPERCAEAAQECANAIENKMLDEDNESRCELATILLDISEVWLARGHGDKAGKCQDRAFENLTAVAASENPPVTVFMDLGRLHGRMATRNPMEAEANIAKAAEYYEKVKEKAGNSADLCMRIGQTKCLLAEMKEEALLADPKDRKLKKAAEEAREETIEAFEEGLELNEKHEELKTAYNECLWKLLALTDGKSKRKPILKDCDTRYHQLKFQLPDSTSWVVTKNEELEDEEVFSAYKVNRKAGQAVTIWIVYYKWDTYYTDEESGSKVGGDNIGGLARRSEGWAHEYFEDIKEKRPLRKCRLSAKIAKAESYQVKGMTEKGNLMEYRCIFFKNSKSQRTYRISIIADLGMLEKNPYELEGVLRSFEIAPRRR